VGVVTAAIAGVVTAVTPTAAKAATVAADGVARAGNKSPRSAMTSQTLCP